MEKQLFEKLISSAKQARNISKGTAKPSRVFTFKPEEIAQIRKQLSLSQGKFADQLGIPISTLRNWEQGRTIPDAPAQTLLRIIQKRPNILSEVAEGRLKAPKVGRVQLMRAAKSKPIRHAKAH